MAPAALGGSAPGAKSGHQARRLQAGGGVVRRRLCLTRATPPYETRLTPAAALTSRGSLTLDNSTATTPRPTAAASRTGTLVTTGYVYHGELGDREGGAASRAMATSRSAAAHLRSSAGAPGGAIDSSGTGTSPAEFSANSSADGGAIYSSKNGSLTINSGTSFDTNTAGEGGAIQSQGVGLNVSVTPTSRAT